MQPQTAVVLGSTGLTGQFLTEFLLNDPAFAKVRILVRRPVQLVHPKLEIEIVDFENLAQYRQKLGKGDCIFCCIGTTQRKVKGDKKQYRKIDVDIPVHAAQIGKDAGFTNYLIVSAVGANPTSANYYLKIKGEVENGIAALQYERFHVFRPSLVLGDRKEFRPLEIFAKNTMKVVDHLLFGKLRRYRSMQAVDIAVAMVAASKKPEHGMFVHHYDDMMNMA